MSEELPTEHFEHAEHAEHAAHSGNSFIIQVSITIALLAVIAATVGSLETLETSAVTLAKNEAVLLQNKATDQWNFFASKSLKKNMYQIAAVHTPANAEAFNAQAARYAKEEEGAKAEAERFEQQADHKLEESEKHEKRHHVLTGAVTLLHISIAVATIAIITKGQRWPWLASIALGVAGVIAAAYAYT